MRQIKIYSVLSIIAFSLLNSCRTDMESEEFSIVSFENNRNTSKSNLSVKDTINNKMKINLFTESMSIDNNPHNMPPVK